MVALIEQTATTVVVYGQEVLLKGHTSFMKCLPVGGHVEDNELYHETALREVFEESGLKVKLYVARPRLPHTQVVQMVAPMHILRYYYTSKVQGGPMRVIDDYLYYATATTMALSPKVDETDILLWATRDKLLQDEICGFQMTRNVRELCYEALDLLGT